MVISALHFTPQPNRISQPSKRSLRLLRTLHIPSISTTKLSVAISNDDFRSEKGYNVQCSYFFKMFIMAFLFVTIEKQFELSLSTPVRYSPLHMKFKGKVLTLWGIFYAAIIFSCSLVSLPLMIVFTALAELAGNGKVTENTKIWNQTRVTTL